MPSKGIGEGIVVKGVKDMPGNQARIERERHGGSYGAKKLSGDRLIG